MGDLKRAVEQWYGVVYEDEGSYRHLFHRCGFSYQRTEKVYKSRPGEVAVAEFEAELEKNDRFSSGTPRWYHSGNGSDECLSASQPATGLVAHWTNTTATSVTPTRLPAFLWGTGCHQWARTCPLTPQDGC
ncbi:MAG: winged helix-turn-helix domain-containing protein [Anaerolineae bacterium]|nr:winged helix-turn-helix domain-containing protein [Anaerolineae bacterium]